MLVWRAVFALSASVLAAACSDAPYSRVYSGPVMGTTYQITVVAVPGHIDPVQLEAGLLDAMRTVNDRMSTYQADSELSRFNRSRSSEWFAVSAELATVAAHARRYSEMSAGAFDVTVGPLVNLWSRGSSRRRCASATPKSTWICPPSPKAMPSTRCVSGSRRRG